MYEALYEFLKGNDVIYRRATYNDARWSWLQTMNELHKHKIDYCAKQSDLTIMINGYTMKFAYRECQIIGRRNVHVFDMYGFDYFQ